MQAYPCKEDAQNAYKSLFSAEVEWWPTITNLGFESLDPVVPERLEAPFTNDEVFRVLRSFKGVNASGPSGFPMVF